jgi:hypothetical protein
VRVAELLPKLAVVVARLRLPQPPLVELVRPERQQIQRPIVRRPRRPTLILERARTRAVNVGIHRRRLPQQRRIRAVSVAIPHPQRRRRSRRRPQVVAAALVVQEEVAEAEAVARANVP